MEMERFKNFTDDQKLEQIAKQLSYLQTKRKSVVILSVAAL